MGPLLTIHQGSPNGYREVAKRREEMDAADFAFVFTIFFVMSCTIGIIVVINAAVDTIVAAIKTPPKDDTRTN